MNYGDVVKSNKNKPILLSVCRDLCIFLNSFVNGIININQRNINAGVSALFETMYYDVTCILAFPKQAHYMSK